MTDHAFHTINFGGEVVSFAIERTTRRKTVAISVGYDGIRVLAPADLDDSRIVGIVRQKGPWVLRKQAGYRELGGAPLVREFVSGETYLYLGRQYRLRVLPDPKQLSAASRRAVRLSWARCRPNWMRPYARSRSGRLFGTGIGTVRRRICQRGLPPWRICLVFLRRRFGSLINQSDGEAATPKGISASTGAWSWLQCH